MFRAPCHRARSPTQTTLPHHQNPVIVDLCWVCSLGVPLSSLYWTWQLKPVSFRSLAALRGAFPVVSVEIMVLEDQQRAFAVHQENIRRCRRECDKIHHFLNSFSFREFWTATNTRDKNFRKVCTYSAYNLQGGPNLVQESRTYLGWSIIFKLQSHVRR